MSKKKKAKTPEAGRKAANSDAEPQAAANGADRAGQNPPRANNGNGAADRETERERLEREIDERLEMLPAELRAQLEGIREQTRKTQELTEDARQSYLSARRSMEKIQEAAKQRTAEMEEQAAQNQERMKRVLADADNFRKRSAEQLENIRKFAVENFAHGVCEIRDCLEAAMESDPENPQALREGVALTLRKLASVMDAHGVQPVNPDIGAQFDPAIHQAVAKSADSPAPKNAVAVVVRKGYTIHERTLRPADVIVSIRNGQPPPPADAARSAKKSANAKPKAGKKREPA